MPILTLDARDYEQEAKNKIISETFDTLDLGERMILINDNDPSPILEKIENERDGNVEWELYKKDPGQYEATVAKIYSQFI